MCSLMFCTSFDDCLLQIQSYCCKDDHSTVVTLHRIRNYFSLYFINLYYLQLVYDKADRVLL
jgi:hypothetical protein